MFDRIQYDLRVKGIGSQSLDSRIQGAFQQFRQALGDQELKLLLLWGIISASAALGYLMWVKYPRLRIVAAAIFLLSIAQYSLQYSGIGWAMEHFGMVAFIK